MNSNMSSTNRMKSFYKYFSENASFNTANKKICIIPAAAASALMLIPYGEMNNELIIPLAALSLYVISVIIYMQPFVYLKKNTRVEDVFEYTPALPEDFRKRNIIRLVIFCLILIPVMILFQLASGFFALPEDFPSFYSTESLSVIYPLVIGAITFITGLLYAVYVPVRWYSVLISVSAVILVMLLIPMKIEPAAPDDSELVLTVHWIYPHIQQVADSAADPGDADSFSYEMVLDEKIYYIKKDPVQSKESGGLEKIVEILDSAAFHRNFSTIFDDTDYWYLAYFSSQKNGEYIPNLMIHDNNSEVLMITADHFQYRKKQYSLYGGEKERLRIIREICSVLRELTPANEFQH